MRVVSAALTSLVLAASTLAPTMAFASGPAVYWGAYIQGAPFETSLIDTFESHAGKRMSIVTWGQPWSMGGQFQTFQTAEFNVARNRGSIPLLTWGSWQLGGGVNQPSFSLARIAGGAYDGYITQWAQAAKAWGHPFMLRFDHEMNGWWYPWSEQTNGNSAGSFVAAWRHVHDIFTQQGATNVSWVWCLNEVSPRSTGTSKLYPGDSYVDWTCVDAYNWGTDRGNAWQTASQVFTGDPRYGGHNSYQELLDVAPSKPIMIGETGSSENGGSKSSWISDFLQKEIPKAMPAVKAVVWYDYNEGDPNLSWPIESSGSAQSAFANSISSSMYASNQYGSLNTAGVPPLSSSGSQEDNNASPSGNPVTLTPVQDTYTSRSDPNSVAGGSATELRADISGTDTTFLRFDLSSLAGKTITSATLRLHITSEAWAASQATFDVKWVYSTDWQEQWMSFNNTAPISSTILGTLGGGTAANTWSQVNLTQLSPIQGQAGKEISMAIVGRGGDVLIVNSRETGGNAPQLVVSYR